jgi:hypothetical protein
MSDRLEEIKEKYSEVTVLEYINDVEIVGVDIKDLVWLINRVEELEQEVNDWRDEAIKWNIRFRESEESHLETKELLYSTISENKRYKQALENITISPIPLEIDDAVNIARQALEGDDD